MNFKKYQRRIPMNFKKIVPLTFAALSVAGALSACSDSTVVGADSQDNSVAKTTTTTVEPVLSSDVQRVVVARLKEVAKPNVPTTAILAHDNTLQLSVIKTFDGDSIYNNEKNRMINMNYLDTTITENKGWTYYSMQDVNGVLHGPIAMAQFVVNTAGVLDYINDIACLNENKWLIDGDGVHKSSDSYEFNHITTSQEKRIQRRSLQTRDSLMLAQFIEDCVALDGKIGREDASYMIGGVEAGVNPKLNCILEKEDYNDSYWEKYASFIVNSCRSDIESSPSVEAALRTISKGTAVTYSHTAGCEGCYQTDSVTAHETFDRVTQSIIDFDPTVRYFDTTRDSRSEVYVAMKDEEGFLHGKIFSSFGVNFKEVNCLNEQEGLNTLYQVYFNGESAPNYLPNKAFKYLTSSDFTLIEEFKKDCVLENGEVDGFDGDVQVACIVNSEEVNGVETYKDPYWDKYAKYIIDSCVSTKSLDEVW